jgi:hypothetical protein
LIQTEKSICCMPEFKFSCPHCGQNIQCDERWGGQEIACPACSQTLVVPQLAVAYASVPAAASPRPITPARPPARSAKAKMSPQKILAWTAGAVAFVVAMYFGLKVANNWQEGFNQKSKEVAAKAGDGELSHIARVYQVLDATDPDKAGDAQARASRRMEKERAKMLEDLKTKPDPTLAMPEVAPNWTLEAATASIPQGRINGTSGGASFHVETVRFDRGTTSAVLAFQEGVGTTADHELFITLPILATDNLAGRTWTVTKDTKGRAAPQIVKRWTMNPKYAPVQKAFSRGYVMKLELDEPTRDWQPGRIFLALPDTNQTVLAGEFSIAIARPPMNDMSRE